MLMEEPGDLLESAKEVLKQNDQGNFTIPAHGLYPHQWLWDSCFIAIGQRHYDVDRAQSEILSLLRGQWANGMIPNMVLSPHPRRDTNMWRSWINPNAPDDVHTSGVTQPPMLAEAVYRIGQKLSKPERRSWYNQVFPALLAFHQWIYADRDPHNEGLALLVHPWETGLDSTPPWMKELHEHQLPVWVTIVEKLHLDLILNLFRRDAHYTPLKQRMSTIESLALFSIQRRLRRKRYDMDKILTHSLFAIEDLVFNSILIRANTLLVEMAKIIQKDLPEELLAHMAKTEEALEQLWDPYTSQYYSRNFVTHKLLKEPSIGTLLPLYAGTISKERAKILVKMLENQHLFGPAYPVPSTPVNSEWFSPMSYWQGPTWINTNWLIIDGLRRNGFNEHAEALKESTLELIQNHGCYEYFNPLTGDPEGSPNFSWTAALAIDLLKSKK